jgi:hypothetical protein
MLNQFTHKCILFNILLFRDGGGTTSINIKFECDKYSNYLKYSAFAGVALLVVQVTSSIVIK